MSTKGPVPKRESQRRHRGNTDPITKGLAYGVTGAPPAPPDHWHPLATQLYNSLEESGQSEFYELSDWYYAQYVIEGMSRNLQQGQRMSAQMFQAVLSGLSNLLVSEGDRRRLRVELNKALEADPDEQQAASAIADFAERYGSTD